ncbi:MAG: ABC transporter permease [Bowdeniella nasicola]|nr:ABC transporter permease [Bowdeniella nasicola]
MRVLNAIGAVWSRDLKRIVRNRAAMISSLVIPGLFVLAFYAAFSPSAEAVGFDYPTYLAPSGMLQAIIFTSGGSALAIALDAENGIHDRVRTCPAPMWALALGRVAADVTRMGWSGGVVVLLAIALGVQCDTSPGSLLALVALGLGVTVILCAGVDGLCLLARRPSSAALFFQSLTIALLMFSTAYVPAALLPDWIAPLIRHVPISPILETARSFMAGRGAGEAGGEALIWLVVLSGAAFYGLTTGLSRSHHDDR